MKKLIAATVLAAALLAAAAFTGVGRPEAARGDASPSTRLVTTSGHGTVTAVPDTASIAAGVRVEAATAAAALARCSARATKVIAALKSAGGRNVQTRQVSVQPLTSPAGRTTGFAAENQVSADVAIAGAGALVDAATAAGATNVDGPTLQVSNQPALYRQALGRALDDARAKAQALAQAGGFSVGEVSSVTESSAAPGPIAFGAATSAKQATPVEPGSQDVTADVQVSFAIG